MVLVVLRLQKKEMGCQESSLSFPVSSPDGLREQLLFQGTADCLWECGGRASLPASPVPLFRSWLGLHPCNLLPVLSLFPGGLLPSNAGSPQVYIRCWQEGV